MKRTERNRGAAMVIVLCVIVVFLALSTTIVLAGSVALNTARNNTIYERGKVQAASLSEVFVKDMQDEMSSLVRYVRREIIADGWVAYDEESDNREDAVREFTMDTGADTDAEATRHQIEIEMYWTDGDPDKSLDGIESDLPNRKSIHFFIDVISTLNDSEYHVKREFELRDTSEQNPEDSEYPWKWKWAAVGRNAERNGESGEGGGG